MLAGVLLYLALRGVDLAGMGDALRQADYRWLAPLLGVAVLSHVLRAWRWGLLVGGLPPEVRATAVRPASLRETFSAVMIGYMVNYVAPRLGEVARTANLSARTKLRFSALFGTVVLERVLDMVVLVLALGSVLVILLDRSAALHDLFVSPLTDRIGWLPALGLAGLAVAVAVLVLLLFRQAIRQQDSALGLLWNRRVAPMLTSFRDGLFALRHTRRTGTLVFSTLAMWVCYGLMAYLPLVILGLTGAYDLSLVDAWAIMILGALGVVVPSPGGVGSYHYITIQTMVHLFAVDQEAAATYAVLSHASQLVLYVVLGVACLLLQGSGLRTLRAQAAPDADAGPNA